MAAELDRRALMVLGASLPFAQSALAVGRGGEPLRLSLNENAFGPSPAVARAIADESGRLSRYADPGDAERLTGLLARKEGVSPDAILLGDNLERLGIHLAIKGGAGGRFVYSAPGYAALIDAAQSFGGMGVPVPLDASLRNDLAALRAGLEHRRGRCFSSIPTIPAAR
ncbi:hypothetical protein BH10PSE13_BH10PSE13_19890 [soil metagenome]